MARGRPRIHVMKPKASYAIIGMVTCVCAGTQSTQEGGAGCDSACRAHSHVTHTGEEAQLSGQTAIHLIITEVPAGGGQGQAGGGAQCVPPSPHPSPPNYYR